MRTPKTKLTDTQAAATAPPAHAGAAGLGGAASISAGSAGGGNSGPEEAFLMVGDVWPGVNVDVLVMSGLE
jgi:hypothetical protein